MNRRRFLQLSSTASLSLAGLCAVSLSPQNNPEHEVIMLVSEELITSLKRNWPIESEPSRWLEIQSDPIRQFAELNEAVLNHKSIVGVSTWMDYIIMTGLYREFGANVRMIKDEVLSDQRGNNVKAYTWVVS